MKLRGRVYVSAVALVMVIGLTACAKKVPPPPPPPPAPPVVAAPPPAPPPPPPPAPAPAPEPPRALTEDEIFARKTVEQLNAEMPLTDVMFDYDQSNIRDDQRATLQRNAEFLRRWQSVRVSVEGHADARGTNEYNLALGERRANTVKEYLVGLGIGTDRLVVVSKGEETPVCTEMTEECYKRNRRGHCRQCRCESQRDVAVETRAATRTVIASPAIRHRHLADVARCEMTVRIPLRVRQDRVPYCAAIEREIGDHLETGDGDVAPRADPDQDVRGNVRPEIRHQPRDHHHLGHAPDAELFAPSKQPAALPHAPSRLQRSQDSDQEERAEHREEDGEEKEAEGEWEPHFAVDDADARDEAALAEDEIADRRFHEREEDRCGKQHEHRDGARQRELPSRARAFHQRAIAPVALRECPGSNRRNDLRRAAIGTGNRHSLAGCARAVPAV